MKSPKATLFVARELLRQKINVLTHADYFKYQHEVLLICLDYQNMLNTTTRYTDKHCEIDELITDIVNTIEWKSLLPLPGLFKRRLAKQSEKLFKYMRENYGTVV